jgi:hypothetical protein
MNGWIGAGIKLGLLLGPCYGMNIFFESELKQ